MFYNLENVVFLANIHEIPGVYLPEQKDNFKIIYYFLTYKGENVNPAFDTAHPAGLVQDFMTLVACPAPAQHLPWSLGVSALTNSRRPVSQLGSYIQQQMLMKQFETLPFLQAGAGQATKIKQLFTHACVLCQWKV